MNIQENMFNRKGFIHHHETPKEDKDFYLQQKMKAHQLQQIGKAFIDNHGVLAHRSLAIGREEVGANSKFLHRGVYCPSPVLDILTTNSKRGKILARPSGKCNITNRYFYDKEDKLIFLDNYIEGKMISSEYLLYQRNNVYGVTIGQNGRLQRVTEEDYAEGRIQRYFWASYSGEDHCLECNQMDCEKFYYTDEEMLDWDYYQIYFSWEKIAPSGFIKHRRYRFTQERGYLKSYVLVNSDGSLIEGRTVHEIRIKRKV